MGKVKDEVSGQKPTKTPQGKPKGGSLGALSQFMGNFFSAKLYKPKQGWYARLYTGLALGLLAAGGVWNAYQASLDYSPGWRLGIPAVLAAILGWVVFRVVQYPVFAEFLIATEAEMNKVSWTTKDDLYRSTLVVLATVLLLAVYLFVVDWFWLFLLRMIGVLQFSGAGGFGSTS
ncbi:preprotein translocase subunit SecE [Planctomyces sp. SH-PL62]|uniref:preprotein translocase subunit SecE n=1 Tax=Planctomyces sp. SH-PL62 TaxID=1636152 RepID=UPI00078DCF02|nr:preprotein translocase subunit SecE [Planctomyces sp. SH-PL62]AMV36396.1 preprotein translocase subunit SecE [Planctomyces sp. SH-PL62]